MSSSRRRWTSALATLLLVSVVTTWLAFVFILGSQGAQALAAFDVGFALSFLVFPLVGWLIAIKLPWNPLGWIFLAFGVAGTIGNVIETMAPLQAHAGNDSAAAVLIQTGGWLYALSILLILGPGVLLFPDGQLPSRRWRIVLWANGVLILLYLLLPAFGTSTVCVEPVWTEGVVTECLLSASNPLHLPAVERINTAVGSAVEPLLALAVVLSLVGLLRRYRQSVGDARQQIKWVLFVATAGIAPLLLTTVARAVFGFTAAGQLDAVLLIFVSVGLPTTIGIAILKYRLYDIDRIISRTAAYAIVVSLLAAVFAGSVTLAQQLLPFQSQFGVVVSTLVVAALFNPLRLRVQNAVDRRFNRAKYDAQGVLDELSARLREEVDLELMQSALLETAQETMQPSHLSLWVRRRTGNE